MPRAAWPPHTRCATPLLDRASPTHPREGERRQGWTGHAALFLMIWLLSCSGAASDRQQVEIALRAAAAALEPTPGPSVQLFGGAERIVLQPTTPLRGVNGLACTKGRLFAASAAGNSIAEITTSGEVREIALPAELLAPDDLVFDSEGNLFVTALRSGAVWRRDPAGVWAEIAHSLPGANGIAIGPGGRLYVSQCLFEDALNELDPRSGAVRRIAGDLGCPNGFFAEPSGGLVVPLLERGELVRIDPATASRVSLASGLAAPTAAKADRSGGALVLEGRSGAILRAEIAGAGRGPVQEMARLPPGLDNLTFCGESLLVSSFLTGAVYAFRPWPGLPRTLLPEGLVTPRGLFARAGEVWIADGVSLKRLREGRLEVVFGVLVDPLPFPIGLTGATDALFVSSPEAGAVFRIDLGSRDVTRVADALSWPTSLALDELGNLLLVETGAGRVLRIDSLGGVSTLAQGLLSPVGLAIYQGRLYTAEPTGGRVLALREGSSPTIVASGLSRPSGLAVDDRGRLFAAEAGAGRVVRIDSAGNAVPLAKGLALDAPEEGLPLPIGLAADREGVLVASPADGSLLRLSTP